MKELEEEEIQDNSANDNPSSSDNELGDTDENASAEIRNMGSNRSYMADDNKYMQLAMDIDVCHQGEIEIVVKRRIAKVLLDLDSQKIPK